jgi:ABC-2 type transport system ATP-binding protein
VRDRLGTRIVATDAAARTVSVGTDGSAPAVRALLDEVDPDARLVARFAVHAASLDDVFLALTGPSARPVASKEPERV